MEEATDALVTHKQQQQQKLVSHESAKALMAHGPRVLHEHVSTRLETALGRALPQMEVRFRNLSVSADIVVVEEDGHDGDKHSPSPSKPELPTLLHTVKKAFASTKKHRVRKDILKNVSGAFKPGTMTLLLGQPSSGKSTLMKVLSGRFPLDKSITLDGDVTYNGVPQQQITKTLPQFAAYVNQRDKHYPVLTVKETLAFAHTFSGSGELSRRGEELLSKGTPEENAAALDAANALFNHYPDIIIQQLGLQNCQNTILGDAMIRGVSGGERKRVTTGEMEFGMNFVTFMDEISTGLDSAATFDIVSTQRSIAKTLRKTVVIALLQPAPEVFALFDDVMILNDGEVMYHGPRDQVVEYFADLGFVCPPERDVADYLLDLGTKQQQQYEVPSSVAMATDRTASNPTTTSNNRLLSTQQHPRSASEFADIFRNSVIYAETLRALDTLHDPDLLASADELMHRTPEFHQSFWENTATLVRRQLLVQLRNTPFIVGRVVMIVVMGLLNASTFYQFDPREIQVVMGIIYAAVLFLSMGQFSQLPTFFAARDVFYKQRRANFFRTPAYVLANSAAQIPLAIGETVLFGSLVYWMCGFASGAVQFLVFEAVVLLGNLAFSAWFFFLAAICPDNSIATPLSLLSVTTTILFSGFMILKSKIPDYFIWVYWINPISWCLRALAVNQYRSSAFDVCEYDGVDYCAENDGRTMGEYYLSLFDVDSERHWITYAMVVLAVQYALFMALSCLALEYKRYEGPENVVIDSSSTSSKQGNDDDDKDTKDPSYLLTETPRGNSDTVLQVQTTTHHATTFVPVTLAFQDLWYSVPSPNNPKHESIDLLKGVTGYALPGTITALMGSSGAGKTTLMDVIAGRKTGGKVQGHILLNGHEATALSICRSTGYCEQMDIHSEASTIREALIFSAFLRQDASVPASAKYDSVTECLDLLDLHDIADQIIRGRSVEQMKRLTIGVELAAQPSVLFLDEPTSGLDARSAKLVMDGVRKVADTGRTVVCTIHQPSSEVFALFDRLLLLKRGGETVFFGDLGANCRDLVEYFEAIPDVAPLPKDCNPATWMLECIGAGVGGPTNVSSSSSEDQSSSLDFVQIFNASDHKRMLDAAMATPGVCAPASATPALMFSHKRAASSLTQMRFVVGRFMDLYWRTPSYSLTRLAMSVMMALLFGVIFTGADYASYQGVNSGLGMLFIVVVFNGFVAFSSVIPLACQERPSFYRERASQTYNALWYFLGSTLAELPYVFLSGLVFTLIFYPMVVGATGLDTAVLFWLNLSLTLLMQAYMGLLFAAALPSEEVAAILGVLAFNILLLFMGFSPPASAIPQGYQWLYHVTPLRFPLAIAGALVFAHCSTEPTYDAVTGVWSSVGPELGCQPLANSPVSLGHTTVKTFTEEVFGMKHDDIGTNFLVLIGYVVGFRVLGALALRFVNHQKR